MGWSCEDDSDGESAGNLIGVRRMVLRDTGDLRVCDNDMVLW